MNPKDIAKRIIDFSNYLSLGTTNGKEPWVNAVFYASDKDFNLYFSSYNDSVHVQNILKNPNVAVAIYDSHIVVGSGKAQGVQIKATCHRVTGEDLLQAIEVLYAKRFSDPKEREEKGINVERFSKTDNVGRVDHIYKIIPEKFYILDKTEGKKDTRMQVKMK